MNLRRVVSAFAVLMALCLSVASVTIPAEANGSWSAAWYSPPFPPTSNLIYNDVRIFDHQTVRQVIRLEASGDELRIRLSNELGLSAVRFGAVHIAFSSPNGVTEPETDRTVTFDGKPGGEIPRGGVLLSDPVNLKVHAFDTVAVSVYYPGRLAPAGHLLSLRISKPGDHTADAVMPFIGIDRAPSIVSGIDVHTVKPRNVIVAFGDSITEGACSTPGWNEAWPEQLALRLAKSRYGKNWTIINSGISGNRLLYNGAGPKGLERFGRDALDIPGVKAIILLEGINDIGAGSTIDTDTGPRSAEDIISAYKKLIARAHARGIKIYGGTMTPYKGAIYYSPDGDKVREAVNHWIRHSGAFDGVIDFDAVMRDPKNPSEYIGAYQCGDNLHPNDAGYAAMAKAVDLGMITGAKRHH